MEPKSLLDFTFNTLRPRQNGRHFPDDIFKRIFLNENEWILIKISLKFVPKGPINNNPALVQIMAWRQSGDKPLSEPMMVSLLTHICVTRPQWVKGVHHQYLLVILDYMWALSYFFDASIKNISWRKWLLTNCVTYTEFTFWNTKSLGRSGPW